MNLVLMRGGYPPALVRKEDREESIGAIEAAQLSGRSRRYYEVIFRWVERSLDIYLEALEPEAVGASGAPAHLLKIGELAREARESVPTIRFWTKEGLL